MEHTAPSKSKRKKLAGAAVRLLVSAALMYYVVTLINFYDVVEFELADSRLISGRLLEKHDARLVVKTDDGETVAVSVSDIREGRIRTVREGFLTVVGKLNWKLFLPFFLLYPAGIFISAARWQILLKTQGIGGGFWQVLRLNYIGILFNNFMLGLTGGDVVKAYLVSRNTDKKPAAVMTILLDRLVGIVALATVAGVVLPFNMGRKGFDVPAIIIYSFLGAFVVFGSLYYSRRVRRTRLFNWFKSILPFRNVLRDADSSLLLYRRKKGVLVGTFAMTLFAHCVAIAVCYGSGISIGITQASFPDYFMFFPVIMMLISLPVSLGGWGLGEALFARFFGLVGVPGEQAVLLSLIGRIMGLVWTLPGGILLAMGAEKVTLSEIRDEADKPLFD